MKAATLGSSRRLCARAIRHSSAAAPIGSAHKVLTQRRAIRMWGKIPCCGGIQWLRRMRSSASLRLARSGSGDGGFVLVGIGDRFLSSISPGRGVSREV